MDTTMQWLKLMSEAPGVSGFENQIRTLLEQRLADKTDVMRDKLGSVIFRRRGGAESPRIMVAAHMDEIGFMVKTVTKEGFLKFTTLGGWWEQVMLGQRVTILTGKGKIPGVIGSKPPHILSPEDRKKLVQKREMYIDIGAAGENEARERFGIRPGDPVVPESTFSPMANDRLLMGKAWDNRVGCAALADMIDALAAGDPHPNTVYAVGTVQEEVGLRGAKTSADVVNPDLALAIDTCVAGDTPGVTEDQAAAKLGKGVAISIYDASMIPHPRLRDLAIETAEQENIPFQMEFSEGGGTDAGRIHLHDQGVPSLVLSVPTRYIHSHNGIIHRDDYDAAVRLLAAVVRKLDDRILQAILR